MTKEFIDGAIDEPIQQGNVGDCWLVSAILALNATKRGKKALKDSIEVDSNGNVTVSFNGLRYTDNETVQYTITAEEIAANCGDNSIFSRGSKDLLVFELAMNKLEEDLRKQGLVNQTAAVEEIFPLEENIQEPEEETQTEAAEELIQEEETPEAEESLLEEKQIVLPENSATYKTTPGTSYHKEQTVYIEGGYPERAMFFLTGIVPTVLEADYHKLIETDGKEFSGLTIGEITDCFNVSNNTAMTFSLYPDPDSLLNIDGKQVCVHKRIDLNRNLFMLELPYENDSSGKLSGHTFSITGVDTENKTVKVVNPLFSRAEYTFSWKQFAAMGVFNIVGVKL